MAEKNGNVNTNPLELAKIEGLIDRAIVEIKALRPTTSAGSARIQAAIKNLQGFKCYNLYDLKKNL